MAAAQKEAQPRRAFLDRRIGDRLYVDAALEHCIGIFCRLQRVLDDCRNHRVAGAGADVDAALARLVQKQLAARLQAQHALRLGFQDAHGLQRRRRDWRRDADAVEKTRCGVLEVFHQRSFAGDVAAAGGQRLAQRAHPDIDGAAFEAEMFADAAAACAHDAERVRLVDHQESLVARFHLDEAGQVGEVAVHAVKAFDGDQHALVAAANLAQQLVQALPVVVRKGAPLRAGKLDALQDAVVDQCVVNDQILGAEQIADAGYIGGMAADEDDAVLDAVKIGQRGLQIALDGAFAGYQAAGGGRGAPAVDGIAGGLADARMAVQREVVVAGKIDVGAAFDQAGGAGNAVMHLEERVVDAHPPRRRLRHQQLFVAGKTVEAAEGIGNALRGSACAQRRSLVGFGCRRIAHAGLAIQKALDQIILGLAGEAEQSAGRFFLVHG